MSFGPAGSKAPYMFQNMDHFSSHSYDNEHVNIQYFGNLLLWEDQEEMSMIIEEANLLIAPAATDGYVITENTTQLDLESTDQSVGDCQPVHTDGHTWHPICSLCGRRARNVSDAKRHLHIHIKPFTCFFQECPRSVRGFGSKHDLERHKKCAHFLTPLAGPTVWYACPHGGTPRCQGKLWARKDNLRKHIQRHHVGSEILAIWEVDVSQDAVLTQEDATWGSSASGI